MPIEEISIQSFRCFDKVKLVPSANTNIIVGDNATGKTTILEAIYALGHGRSFRTHQIEPLIATGSDYYQVVGKIQDAHLNASQIIGIQRSKHKQIAKINGQMAYSQAELAKQIAVQIIDPNIARLITGAPSQRRKYLDWSVFHVKPNFLTVWKKYNRVLQQRNSALRKGANEELLASFDVGLVEYGDQLTQLRQEVFNGGLLPIIQKNVGQLLGSVNLDVAFHQGWTGEKGESLQAKIEKNRSRDCFVKSTTVGPHKADITITHEGRLAKLSLSSGQQKLLAIALIFSEFELLLQNHIRSSVLLIDDLIAELDQRKVECVLAMALQLQTQLWITALQPTYILDFLNKSEEKHKVFHVKHAGGVASINYSESN